VSHSKTISKPKAAAKSPYQIQVVDRALALLDVLSQHGPNMTLMQIAEALKLHKSTAHRLIMVLERHRLIEKNSDSGKYRLGLRLFELGTHAMAQLDLRERAHPYLERAVLEAGETVHLCVYDAGEVVYLDKVEPDRTVRMSCGVGRRNPAYCTSVGKAMMAFLPEAQVEADMQKRGFRQFTRHTITNMLELKAELEKVRRVGFAMDDEEIEDGVRCVGAPVWGFAHQPIAAISVSGPAFRMNGEKIPAVAKCVVAMANALSKELGFEPRHQAASAPSDIREIRKAGVAGA
jgi:DNA-binding IclR family transcriptional regulator